MTDQELIKHYTDLLIAQYASKPKALATVGLFTNMNIMNQIPIVVQDAFSLNTAIGVQLDVLGKYAGVTRTYGSITLVDSDFRTLIKIAIIKNNSNSDLYSIQKLIQDFFPGTIIVFDYKGMRMSFYLDTSLGSYDFAKLVIDQGLLPSPMGVQLSATIYGDAIGYYFGFGSYERPAVNNSPFSTYQRYLKNLFVNSEVFTGAGWTGGNSWVQENMILAPNGTMTAASFDDYTKFTDTIYYTQKPMTKPAISAVYTCSVFIKKIGGRFVKLTFDGGSSFPNDNVTVYFDLQDKVSGAVQNNGNFSGGIFSFKEYADDWIQLSITCTTGPQDKIRIMINTAKSLTEHIYKGTGSTKIGLWGVMIRLGTGTEYVPNPLYVSAPSSYWLTYPDSWLNYSDSIT